MPKINIPKTLLIFLTLLIIAVFVMALIIDNKDDLKNTNSPVKQQPTPLTNDFKDKATVQKNLEQVQISPINSEQLVTKLDKPLFFSDDAFINHSIILGLYQDCIELLYLHINKGIGEKYKNASQIINKRISERFKYCQKVNDEHPDFNLDDSEKFYKKHTGSNSLLEKAFNYKVEFGEDYISDSQFIKELSQTDPRILLNRTTIYVMSSFHMSNSTAIVMKLIDSQHTGQVWWLLDVGQRVYNCNLNGGCNKNSSMMFGLCKKNEDLCHLENYNEYIKFIMTKGQQADLAIVVKYIETLFENQ